MNPYTVKFSNAYAIILFANSRSEAIEKGVELTRGMLLTPAQQRANLTSCRLKK